MAARTPRAALGDYVDRFSRLAGCITDQPLIATGVGLADAWSYVGFAPAGATGMLRLPNNGRLSLYLRIGYDVSPDPDARNNFIVRTAGYSYRVIDPIGDELLAYHWHPVGLSPVTWPHVHVSRVPTLTLSTRDEVALSDAHLPTGFVRFSDVVRMLIMELGVRPRRPAWRDIVEADDPTI